MKKRIGSVAIITKYFWPVAAGIETNILETYASLVESGWKVSAYTSKNSLTESNVFPADKEIVRKIDVFRHQWHWYGFWPSLDTDSVDIVALHNFNVVPHFFFMLKTIWLKLRGKKQFALTLTPHGGYNPEWRVFPWLQRVVKRFYHQTLGTMLINASVDAVRAVSEWERQEMIAMGIKPQLITVIHNGIEDQAFENNDDLVSDVFKQKIKRLGRYLLQIGRIHTIKNYETTIKALQNLPSDISFVIAGPVGEEWYLESLKQLIKELGLESRVHFIGVVRGAEKYYLIKKACMMVHMAIWESYCNVVHEGMSQGLVCLVANNTALPLLIKNGVNGFCIETKDVTALTEKILFVLNPKNKHEVARISKYNKVSVKEHSWRNVAKRVDQLYQGLLK